MAKNDSDVTDRLRFPVAGRSVKRVKRDAKLSSRESGQRYNHELNRLCRAYGLPLAWSDSVKYLEQYNRLQPANEQGLPESVIEHLIPDSTRITLVTGDCGSATHSATRNALAGLLARDSGLTALVYQDELLAPNRHKHIGHERPWLDGTEIADVLNDERLPAEEAATLADELTYTRQRMDEGVTDFNRWRSGMMKELYVHSSSLFPGSRFRWNSGVLYVSASPTSLRGTTETLSANLLGARAISINAYIPEWGQAFSPKSWGLPDNNEILLTELLSKVDTIVHRKTIVTDVGHKVFCHSHSVIDPAVSAELSDGTISLRDWQDAVNGERVAYSDDIIRLREEKKISDGIADMALGKIEQINLKNSQRSTMRMTL